MTDPNYSKRVASVANDIIWLDQDRAEALIDSLAMAPLRGIAAIYAELIAVLMGRSAENKQTVDIFFDQLPRD